MNFPTYADTLADARRLSARDQFCLAAALLAPLAPAKADDTPDLDALAAALRAQIGVELQQATDKRRRAAGLPAPREA